MQLMTRYIDTVGLKKEQNQKLGKNAEGAKAFQMKKAIPWNSTILANEKKFFNTLLPPILQPSKKSFAKYVNKIGRSVI